MDDSDSKDLETGAGSELISGELTFKPLYIISSWVEQSTVTKRLCVAIILPSGGCVGSGNFSITVVDGGQFLQLAVRCPHPLMDVLAMHRWKLSDAQSGFMSYHPLVLGFEASLSELRKRSSDAVESVDRILLPCAVQSQVVSKHNLAVKEGGGTKMLYDLTAAAVEEYGVVADTDAFTEVRFLFVVGNTRINSLFASPGAVRHICRVPQPASIDGEENVSEDSGSQDSEEVKNVRGLEGYQSDWQGSERSSG